MSLFGALNTAISGLTSQSAAFGDISDNVANSQTIGFKRIDTAFIDYLTTSNASNNQPGSVVARPEYVNTVEGGVTQTDNPLAMAINGQGFFAVSQSVGVDSNGNTQFSPQQYYSRAGDFTLNKSGYLVNSAGFYLDGWSVSQTGAVDKTTTTPIRIDQSSAPPVPTANVQLAANLPPSTAGSGAPSPSTITVYDAQGQAHQLSLAFTSTGANAWSLSVTDDASPPNVIGTAAIGFGADGTIASIAANGGAAVTTAGAAATVTLATHYPATGGGTQAITLNLGNLAQSDGLTQFAGSTYTVRGITQDGTPPGSFSSVTTTSAGAVVVNYDNGTSRTVAQVPVTVFNAPDALQRQDGSAFTADQASGLPLAQDAGNAGAGGIVTSSTEASNVDISTEFSKLIVAQQAYSANAKIVTSADQLLQTTIDMKR